MSARALEAVQRWRKFADTCKIHYAGSTVTWREYSAGRGYVDEERLIQPTVFPAFARDLLGWEVNTNLAPEESGREGKPDFTPADSVTHPFVFETKNTKKGVELTGDEGQVARYLKDGSPRIRQVVLTNLVGLKVFELDEGGSLREVYRVDLRALLSGNEQLVALDAGAERLADFFEFFKRRDLTIKEKIQQVRDAPPWNPKVEVTSSDWIRGRLDRVVRTLTTDVLTRLQDGSLDDPNVVDGPRQERVLDELRLLEGRISGEESVTTLAGFMAASDNSVAGKARRQYAAHVAYFATTRLMLVRTWEDLGLLEPMLYDGGFNNEMVRFDEVVRDVVDWSFTKAKTTYQSLFNHENNYTWFVPSDDNYADVIYELANTYLGNINSDVLGEVYERMLERIDRKLLGVYYTPRDVIALIWDLIDLKTVAQDALAEDRVPRILDIATGSGGFLVEAAVRLRQDMLSRQQKGSDLGTQTWINQVADSLTGVEYARFSAYLAELNLLVQMGHAVATVTRARIPSMGIINTDTLSLHDPDTLYGHRDVIDPLSLLQDSDERVARADRIRNSSTNGFLMDVACGNPPYIGEKSASPIMQRTRRDFPYWEQFVGPHMDYLYWFLILGVSKLREGGRFGFITTEYWLRAAGAKPLRAYLAQNCSIDRIVLFRDFRLFPDAPGQHSMIVTGTRLTSPDGSPTLEGSGSTIRNMRPRVSVYDGTSVPSSNRRAVLEALRDGASRQGVKSFVASMSPQDLGAGSWADVVLTRDQLGRLNRLRSAAQAGLKVSKGVETTLNKLDHESEKLLTVGDLADLGGPGFRAGIQLLTSDEVQALGTLNQLEQDTLRTVINTKDVYPYAAIPDPTAGSVVYLSKLASYASSMTDDHVIESTPFPAGMPTLEARMSKFRTLLLRKTKDRNERRPWWTLHRARADVLGDPIDPAAERANFALTTRWGGGGRLVVGVPPQGVSPASGLHILKPTSSDIPATYLAALFNSRVFQEITDTLPPGQLRQADLESLGLPLIQDQIEFISESGAELARSVTRMIETHSPLFPGLPTSLREDMALDAVPVGSWVPPAFPAAASGPLNSVGWVSSLTMDRAGSTRISDARIADDLFGIQVHVFSSSQDSPVATLSLTEQASLELAETVVALIRGVGLQQGTLSDLASTRVLVNGADLVETYRGAREALMAEVQKYRLLREGVDAVFA